MLNETDKLLRGYWQTASLNAVHTWTTCSTRAAWKIKILWSSTSDRTVSYTIPLFKIYPVWFMILTVISRYYDGRNTGSVMANWFFLTWIWQREILKLDCFQRWIWNPEIWENLLGQPFFMKFIMCAIYSPIWKNTKKNIEERLWMQIL